MKKLITILLIALSYIGFSQEDIKIQSAEVVEDGIIYGLQSGGIDTLITNDASNPGLFKVKNITNPVDDFDAMNLITFQTQLAGLNLTEITDPAINEATSTAIIDTAQGVFITLTTDGNDQTMQQPTSEQRRRFIVMNNSASLGNISVTFDAGSQTKFIIPGTFNVFIYDSLEWSGNNITSTTTLNTSGTGLFEGGFLSIDVDPTKFDLSAGDGIIIDNVTDHEKPTKTEVSWNAFDAVTVTNIASTLITYIGIDISGSIIQQITPFTQSQKRSIIDIGRLGHIDNVNITSLSQTPRVAFDQTLQTSDLSSLIGAVTEGNNYSGVLATLNIDKTSGKTYREGVNYVIDRSSPNISTDAAGSALTFNYAWRDGFGGLNFSSPTTNIDPSMYDDGDGTLAAVSSNDFTNQRIFFFPGSNLTFVLYGQNVYNTFAEAKASAGTEQVEIPADAAMGSVLRNILILKQNLATFSDPITDDATFEFLPVGKFGELSSGASASATTLQQAYNNSIQPQIITSGGLGAIQFKGGTGNDTDNTLEGLNNAGATTFSLDGNGLITTSDDIAVNGTTESTSTITGSGVFGGGIGVDGNGYFGGKIVVNDSLRVEGSTLLKGSISSSVFGINERFGINALFANTTGGSNSTFGNHSLFDNTAGGNNSAFGHHSLRGNITGNGNTAVGYFSLRYNTAGSDNSAMGRDAGREISGGGNLTSATSSTFVGVDTRANANAETNQIVIGANAIGNGSNTVTLGDDNLTDVYMGENGGATIHTDSIISTSGITSFDGNIEVNGTTESTSTITGAVTIPFGGIGVDGNGYIGGKIVVEGNGVNTIAGTLSIERTGVSGAGQAGVLDIRTDGKTINDGNIFTLFSRNSADEIIGYGALRTRITDPTDGSEDGDVSLYSYVGGVNTESLKISGGNTTLSGTLTVDGTGDSYVMGNFGVGTIPDTKFQSYNSSSPTQARFGKAVAGTSPLIRWTGRNIADLQTSQGVIELDSENLEFNIYAPSTGSPTIKAIITKSDGTVLIGTETAVGSELLGVDGDGYFNGDLVVVGNFETKAGEIQDIITKTADYTLTGAERNILADATSNTVTITLDPSPVQGQVYDIFCINSTFTCTVARNGNNINGVAADQTLTAPGPFTVKYDTAYGWFAK